MKKLFTLVTILVSVNCFAQDSVKRTNFVSASITERFMVLSNNKKVRVGSFTATYNKILIAKGRYSGGSRTGDWNFFNAKAKLVQTYNYNSGKFSMLDTADLGGLTYYLEGVKPGDAISTPVKIGGSCYGLLPLLDRDELSRWVKSDFPGLRKATYVHTIIVDSKGYISSHTVKVTVVGNGGSKTYKLDDTKMDPELTRFTPPMLNNKPVACKIVTETKEDFDGVVNR